MFQEMWKENPIIVLVVVAILFLVFMGWILYQDYTSCNRRGWEGWLFNWYDSFTKKHP